MTKRTFAIGDLHGDIDQLFTLMQRLPKLPLRTLRRMQRLRKLPRSKPKISRNNEKGVGSNPGAFFT